MKCNKLYILLLTMHITCIVHGWPKRPPPTKPMIKRLVKPTFPPDFRARDLPNIRIPSNSFCQEQELQPAEHYVVLPWWYHYCQEMRSRRARRYRGAFPNIQIYMNVLDRINKAKKEMGKPF